MEFELLHGGQVLREEVRILVSVSQIFLGIELNDRLGVVRAASILNIRKALRTVDTDVLYSGRGRRLPLNSALGASKINFLVFLHI